MNEKRLPHIITVVAFLVFIMLGLACATSDRTTDMQSEPKQSQTTRQYHIDDGHLIIYDGVTSIGEDAFYDKQLTSVTIPNSVTSIGDGAFGENQLTSVTIPDSVTSIGDNAFMNNQLTSVTIPNSVTSIGDFAFAANNPLTNIVIPDSVGNLHEDVFAGSLRNVTRISIGANVNLYGYSDVVWSGFRDSYRINGNRAGTYTLNNGRWSVQFR